MKLRKLLNIGMNPETKKVLIALAQSLRKSKRNVREKEQWAKQEGYDLNHIIPFQARAKLHAANNMYFVAKKSAGITGYKLFRGIM
jgi:hypothetical protein